MSEFNPQIVLDTNVLYSGLRSRRGASYRILQRLGTGAFELHVSVGLILEYRDVCLRLVDQTPHRPEDIDALIDYLCSISHLHSIFFRWRPVLTDPCDDFVLELAIAAGADIVTHNERDFRMARELGVRVLSPAEFLELLGDNP